MTDHVTSAAEVLTSCECGHGLGEHNGLGCYARLSYEPLVTCSCALTDDRTDAELVAQRLPAHDAQVAAQALRETADSVPVDFWCTYGMAARAHVEGFQKWLRGRADRIEQEAGAS